MSEPLLYCRGSDGLYFKGTSNEDAVVLQLVKKDHALRVVSLKDFPESSTPQRIAALLGFIRLKVNTYAILAETVEEACRLSEHTIYKVARYSIVAADGQTGALAAAVDSDESMYVKLLDQQLQLATLYFSYTYDLTNSLQRNEKIGPYESWQSCDRRFFWNYYLTRGLRTLSREDSRANMFVQPVIYGYAKCIQTVFHATPIHLGLITRRSIFRAGTRYFRRGIDADGNVGNFNETEQFLIVQTSYDGSAQVYSFLQTRGSVPVYWAEVNDLKYKPNLVLGPDDGYESTKKHFEQQIDIYGDNYLVNLVNQKGHELPVKEAYENAVAVLDNPRIHYIYFDFHHECRNMKWHRVKILIDQLRQMGMSNGDYFLKIVGPNGITETVVNEQKSTVRTNCMDCLDRTNVVQSVLAQWVLQNSFESCKIVSPGEHWESDQALLMKFQNLWADNADAVSISYSGTGALKTDFTRTGKRTRVGALKDFLNSALRYYLNNFGDGPRQDSYDLFLGGFEPQMHLTRGSKFADHRPLWVQITPMIIYAALTVLLATIIFPKEHFTSLKNVCFFIGSGFLFVTSSVFAIQNGMQYVNWPRLVDLDYVVSGASKQANTIYKLSKNYRKPRSSKKD